MILYNIMLYKIVVLLESLWNAVYRTRETFGGGKHLQIWQIASYLLKFSSPIFTYTLKMYLA